MGVSKFTYDWNYTAATSGRSRAIVYWSLAQAPELPQTLYLYARSEASPSEVAELLNRAIHEVEPGAFVTRILHLEDVANGYLRTPRFYAMLLGVFAVLALALAATGVAGVVAQSVAGRTREIGIRMALGAHAAGLQRRIVWETWWAVGGGCIAGLVGAVLLTRLLESMLYGVAPNDVWTLAGAALSILGLGLLAALIPARRATQIDPMRVLTEG